VSKSNAVIASYQQKLLTEENQLSQIILPIETKIVTKYVTRTITIHDNSNTNASVIQNNVTDKSILSQGFIASHNAAVQGQLINPIDAANITPSGVTDVQALEVVANNYAICLATKEQLIALQQLDIQIQAAIDQVNKLHK
jgi:hypothetical protein